MDPGIREVCERRLAKYRETSTALLSEVKLQRAQIWEDGNGHGLNIIPGLPDDIVESFIWSKVCQYVEEVRQASRRGYEIKDRIETVRALAHTSRKWRHVVQHSKPWGALKTLMADWKPEYWELYPQVIMYEYWSLMLRLPPLDIFFGFPQDSLRECRINWLLTKEKPERDIYLALYPDPVDVTGRLRRWKEWRDDPNCWENH